MEAYIFLKQCQDINIQRKIEYLSEIENVSFCEYYPKPEEFGGSIRAARRVCIDAILSESYCTYFLTVDNDATCTLTGIVKNPRLSYNIDVTYVRTPEKIKEEDAKIKEEHSKMETTKELQKHALNIGLIFGHETGYDRQRNIDAIKKAFKKAKEMNGVVHILELCEYPCNACEIKCLSESKNVSFYKHIPKAEEFGGNLIAAQRACMDIILSESHSTYFVTVENDPLCTLTRIYNDTSRSYSIDVTYVRALVQIAEIDDTLADKQWLKYQLAKRKEFKDDLQIALERARIRYDNDMNLTLRRIIETIKT